jgi:hypothetical protein
MKTLQTYFTHMVIGSLTAISLLLLNPAVIFAQAEYRVIAATIGAIVRAEMPFNISLIIILLLISYIPALTLYSQTAILAPHRAEWF